jgi:hypothetical protein
MSKPIILGTPGAIEQTPEYTGGPYEPVMIRRRWRGPKAALKDLIKQVSGWQWSLTGSGPNQELEAHIPQLPTGNPDSEVPTDIWQLLPGEIEKDILEANIAVSNALTIADKEKLRNAIKDNVHVSATSFTAGAQSAGVEELQELMFEGVKSIETSLPVLQLTRITSSSYTVLFSQEHCDTILSTATLYNDEAVPTNFLIAFDVAPYNVTASVRSRLHYGWFKKRPTLTTMSGGRVQIVQNFKFGLWPTLLYGAPI